VFESLEPRGDENLRKMPNSGRTVRAVRQEDRGYRALNFEGASIMVTVPRKRRTNWSGFAENDAPSDEAAPTCRCDALALSIATRAVRKSLGKEGACDKATKSEDLTGRVLAP
jgi:hypothetical protein